MHSYQAALDYIYSFIDPTRKGAATPDEAARNVLRMRALLDAAGRPDAAMPSLVVAGTKGKGSTCAMVESIGRAAGLRTGLFSSPHLSSYRERMQIDREPISQAELITLVERLRPLLDGLDPEPHGRPTTFDVGLLLALTHFAEHDVGLAVLEVGLGGRYDAVNAITPLASAISSISYDHMGILGHSLAEIADNKAGIIKPGVSVVCAPQLDEAAAVVVAEATAQAAALFRADPEGLTEWVPAGATRPYPTQPQSALRGAFQRENAALALGAALLLRERGLDIPDAALAAGLANVSWPGRFELLAGPPQILIDGAHNGDSARKLLAAVSAELRYERLILVLGTSQDKDIAAICAALVPAADAVVLTQSGHPRAMDLDRIVAGVQRHLRGPLLLTANVPAALEQARDVARPTDLILITGSLFVVAAAREALGLAEPD